MADQTSAEGQYTPFLSTTQQDLLLAALSSNTYTKPTNPSQQTTAIKRSDSDSSNAQYIAPTYLDGRPFNPVMNKSDQAASLDNYDFDDTSPYLDYLDDSTLNFTSTDLGGDDMFGPVPGPRTESSESDKAERSDKRKKSDDGDEEDLDGDAKRREGDDKKKPGRKPLTSEPTTKRKAQNRAAQRAFRDRKEKHLKDLETKVELLTKANEADKEEKGVLRAQIERLQTELREYKTRMSMNSTGISQSPPNASRMDVRSDSKPGSSDFTFDFHNFGGLPGSQPLGNLSRRDTDGVSPSTQLPRQASQSIYQSPRTQMAGHSQAVHKPASAQSSRSGSLNVQTNMSSTDGFNSTLPQMPSSLFTPSILNPTSGDYGFTKSDSPQTFDNGGDSHSGISRAFRFNSNSSKSNTASPSTSSLSQFNPNSNSSCGTSPDSALDSPPADATKAKTHSNTYSFNSDPTDQNSFAKIANTTSATDATNPGSEFSFDWLANQNGGQFDPVLFGDYRDSQEAIVGDGDFNNGFFNEAFPYDFGSPLNFDFSSPKTQQRQTTPGSRNLLDEVDKARDGDDSTLSAENKSYSQQVYPVSQEKNIPLAQADKMLNCNNIWSQLQKNHDFQDGKFDLDGLCAELRAKAKCSESGVTVPAEQVDAAFKKLGGVQPNSQSNDLYSTLTGADYVFQRDSVEEAMKKLAGGM